MSAPPARAARAAAAPPPPPRPPRAPAGQQQQQRRLVDDTRCVADASVLPCRAVVSCCQLIGGGPAANEAKALSSRWLDVLPNLRQRADDLSDTLLLGGSDRVRVCVERVNARGMYAECVQDAPLNVNTSTCTFVESWRLLVTGFKSGLNGAVS